MCVMFKCFYPPPSPPRLGVDYMSVSTLKYPDNRFARLTTTMACDLTQKAYIHGTKGCIEVLNHEYLCKTIDISWVPN